VRSSIADFILLFAFVKSDELLLVQDSRQFEIDVHISGGALLRVSFPQGPQLQSMVRVLLNYLDMHLNWLTALNA
jgi:hypothetical protein